MNIESINDPYVLLFSLTRILNTGNSLVDALESFLGATATVLGMDRLAILVNPSPQDSASDRRQGRISLTLAPGYRVLASHNFATGLLENIGENISAAVRRGLDSDEAADEEHDHFVLSMDDQGEPAAFYVVPLAAGMRETGLLVMVRRTSDNYDYNLSFLSSLADQIAFAIARDQDLRLISDQHRKVSALFATVREMDVTLSQDEMVDRFIKGIYGFLPYDTGALLLCGDKGLSLRCATVGGRPPKSPVMNTAVRLVEFFNHEMAEPEGNGSGRSSDRPDVLEIDHFHYPTDPSIPGHDADMVHTIENLDLTQRASSGESSSLSLNSSSSPFGTEFILPLKIENQRLGVIYVAFREKNLLDSHDAKLLSIVGYHLATVLENGRLFKKNKKLAYTDGVTGVANHRLFQETLEAEFGRARRYSNPLSVLLMDVDHFKNFNDTYGHRHGDTVLREIGRVLESTARRNIDTVARYGGEEFTIIVPSTAIQGALALGERIRRAVEEREIRTEDGRLTRVTVSVGVSTAFGGALPSIETPESLIESADRAMYNAKNNGRNRVETLVTSRTPIIE
ncbi:MAG: hypothetical protein CVV64_08660 [Candidatus Wallbacteria bacterium HGW-Wallbacteria-1]|uniref:GGDEF domain-containing protein n=1 Tax=Candidatus Wallbacteria bacterium HGW-Wallbacteria-1 TaxID=2013854 RepID=A0A2N1PQ15_9BACT|nr:MAG: hypothetical protein CVV64_08660 [Candidatus Wallbacteria bacterium HGW-Wallbacteria-1]